jgi:hypothetical protein
MQRVRQLGEARFERRYPTWRTLAYEAQRRARLAVIPDAPADTHARLALSSTTGNVEGERGCPGCCRFEQDVAR